MARGIIGYLEIELYLPGTASLKEKRSMLKPLLSRMRNQFNVANAEIDHHDVWQSAVVGITTVSNSTSHCQQMLQTILNWIEQDFPDLMITHERIEIL
jgi:hypothetical protein